MLMFFVLSPKTVQVHHVIKVSDLRKTLPQTVFETSPSGEGMTKNLSNLKWDLYCKIKLTKSKLDLKCLVYLCLVVYTSMMFDLDNKHQIAFFI